MINPAVPGFNPDPSVVRVDGTYYVVTSSFDYLPGLPVYRSDDLVDWEMIGHVATRPEQVQLDGTITNAGVYAPTIRHRDGVFYVIVSVVLSPVGCVLFTATDPAGPWSDGLTLDVNGIDPDLAWDDDGSAYVTFSGHGELTNQHPPILQARVDLETGALLEEPRSLWPESGRRFPEAPHVYRRGDFWYLVVAEGGTERGHGVSVARSRDLTGPFVPHPDNPVLTAAGTARKVQNTGHGDLVEAPDGGTALILLGVRPLGAMYGYSPLGRETFVTRVDWVDDWPIPAPVELTVREGVETVQVDFADPAALEGPAWLAVGVLPTSLGALSDGRLVLDSGDTTLASRRPAFLGQRVRHHRTVVSTLVDATAGQGGLALRYDENHWVALEARGALDGVTVVATASISGMQQQWEASLPRGDVRLRMETLPVAGFSPELLGGERIRLLAESADGDVLLAELDGRYWSAETAASFTGRVVGLCATQGSAAFRDFRYRGTDQPDLDLEKPT